MSEFTQSTEDWHQRWWQLVNKIERVQTSTEKQMLIVRLSQPEKPFVLAFANAHAMNSAAISPPFFKAIYSADMILRDGSGMATLMKLLHMSPGLNLNGTDLIPELLKQFNGRRIALFGTQSPHLDRALQVAAKTLAPQSSYFSAHGFHEISNYTAMADLHRPELIILGMGMPKQEDVAAALRLALSFPCLIVCGGAIIDFLGGKAPRAPAWIRGMGLEWLFRLAIEPRRLFQRYVIGNPIFLSRAVRLASISRR
ncbi:MAG: glycosyl transferase, WecB/TagA/CpsF family [Polaromonas sp.]|nr:glycosyl transferase, WecB/TagA/CpsF family [Polaromonas sp.]